VIKILEPNNVNTEPRDELPDFIKRYDKLELEINFLNTAIGKLCERMGAEEDKYQKLIELNIQCKDSTVVLNYPTTYLEKLDLNLINMGNQLEDMKSRKYELEKIFEAIENTVEKEGWYKQRSISSPPTWKKS